MWPILFELGGLRVPTYGAFLAAGFLAGLVLVRRRAPALGLDADRMQTLAALLVLGGGLGSRLWFVLEGGQLLGAAPWKAVAVWEGGAVWYGGLLGGIAALCLARWRQPVPLADLGDLFFPAAAVGHLFGRLGCFAAGCCWGKPTDLPWGVVFPVASACRNPGVPLHPTQLYEAAAEALILVALLFLWRRRRWRGEIALAYVALYALARLALEPLRGDGGARLVGGRLSLAQVTSLALLAVASTLWLRARARAARAPVATPN
jgi:phosphatidylglycerol:prolipoprotein diacylglycerol transferase